MSLEPPDQQFFEAAVGYSELGMPLEADAELDKIDPFNRAAPEVIALRIAICHATKKWELMRELAKRLCEFEPQNVQWRVSLAYGTRRAASIEAAKEILLEAEPRFPDEPVIYYNLACYEAQLGDLTNAKKYLKRTFELEPKWRAVALDDEDLKVLWDAL